MDPLSSPSLSGTPAHPNRELWDNVYEKGKDYWTAEAVDEHLMKFHDTFLTEGRSNLDILVPMCGKTQVMLLLSAKGHRVVGIEWSKAAVERFFEENGLEHSTRQVTVGSTDMTVYAADHKAITIYCGDFFAFKEENLGGFDCIFDHGAIGCFDFAKDTRSSYAEIINSFTRPGGRILLSTFDYEHSEHPTIPFAVTEEEIRELYKEHFNPPQLLADLDDKITTETFNLQAQGLGRFPVWTFSRFSWKILLLVKPTV